MRILEDSPAVRVLEDRGIRKGIQQGIQQGVQQGIQQGVQQGIQQGVQQGIQQGVQQGIQQGVQQGIQQTAINMLQEGDDFSKVARVTGLDIERVIELNDELLAQKSGV